MLVVRSRQTTPPQINRDVIYFGYLAMLRSMRLR